ncbi:salicylate hydroxylase [Diaporthe helianthi]|uniref:Salicylate hydroxylase n=1 Tax=Diaporthe helianthi TaxID=158607 RepID=A0A2P5I8S1_DIAHE|nr:salicylate hydroxylase [Diaporthe helianthi]
MSPASTPQIAIIGAGITGLTLAAGLQARGIPYTVYERAARNHHQRPGTAAVAAAHTGGGGAGIGLSPNAERAMGLLSPAVAEAYEQVANPNGEDYFQWVDGVRSPEVYFRLFVGEGMFRGCRRADLLEGVLRGLPEGRVVFGKALREVRGREDGGGRDGVRLVFEDGTEEVADAVIGCDGIHSRLRTLLFGPESKATYSQKYSFRALIPMDQARSSLPARLIHLTTTRYMYNGPGAHIITYPIANNTLLNTLVVVSDPNPVWTPPVDSRNPHVGKVAVADEVGAAFEGWHPDVRAIVGLLPRGGMDKWAIFDMVENPVPRYHGGGSGGDSSETSDVGGGAAGKVTCLAGDAAHACGPHLGAGAGFGIEDAYLLAELLQAAVVVVKDVSGSESEGDKKPGGTVGARLAAAFEVYSDMRYDRTQWLVKHTRDAVDLFQWKDRELSRSADGFGREITWRFHKIWHYDIEKMVEEAKQKMEARR